jgi:SnoaL-like domain
MPTLADDAVAIANLKAAYCTASDLCPTDRDAAMAGFRAVFIDDVVGDYGFRVFNGFDDLTGFMTTAVAGSSEWMVHMLHSPRIAVDGDRATGDWTVMGQMKRREGGAIDTVLGRYSDELVRTPEGWRIAKVTFTRYS